MAPIDIYAKVKDLGYDWDFILGETRGWMGVEQYKKDLPVFFSSVDLLYLAVQEKKPYWKKG